LLIDKHRFSTNFIQIRAPAVAICVISVFTCPLPPVLAELSSRLVRVHLCCAIVSFPIFNDLRVTALLYRLYIEDLLGLIIMLTMAKTKHGSQNPSFIADEVLIQKFRKGDVVSFERLVQRYSNYVVSIAYNIVGDVHIASDMAQETFIKIFHGLYRLEDARRFKGWLYSVVRSVCIDWLRKEKVRPVSIDKIQGDGISLADKMTLNTPSAELEELRERILITISSLPKIYQQIVLLKHLGKHTYKEISEKLGIPIATVESRLYRARLMLKDRLQDFYL